MEGFPAFRKETQGEISTAPRASRDLHPGLAAAISHVTVSEADSGVDLAEMVHDAAHGLAQWHPRKSFAPIRATSRAFWFVDGGQQFAAQREVVVLITIYGRVSLDSTPPRLPSRP